MSLSASHPLRRQTCLALLAGLTILLTPAPGQGAPLLEILPADPPDIPPGFKADYIVAAAVLRAGIPIAPAGWGSALAYGDMGKAALGYRATEEFVTRPPAEGGGRELVPRASEITVKPLGLVADPITLQGKGAPRLTENLPTTVRVVHPDGTRSIEPVRGKGSAATVIGANTISGTEGLMGWAVGGWFTERDIEPDTAGDQGGLLNLGFVTIARSENGPLTTTVIATETEHHIGRMPRGSVALAPVVGLDLVTTLGLPSLPKPGRSASVMFNFEGYASFARDPLWSLLIEYTDSGSVLSAFSTSTRLRRANDAFELLDDEAILADIREELRVDAAGKPSVAGGIHINDYTLFNGQVRSRAPWEYTQRLVVYSRLEIPEPPAAALLGLALAALLGFRPRRARR